MDWPHLKKAFRHTRSKSEVLNRSEGHMRTNEVIRGLHYDADATTAIPEPH